MERHIVTRCEYRLNCDKCDSIQNLLATMPYCYGCQSLRAQNGFVISIIAEEYPGQKRSRVYCNECLDYAFDRYTGDSCIIEFENGVMIRAPPRSVDCDWFAIMNIISWTMYGSTYEPFRRECHFAIETCMKNLNRYFFLEYKCRLISFSRIDVLKGCKFGLIPPASKNMMNRQNRCISSWIPCIHMEL